LFGAAEADAPTWVCKIPPSSIEKLIPNQSVFSLNGTPLRIATLRVTHSKDERGPESGFRILSNLFIVNNMAERVEFEFTRKRSFNNKERTAGTVKQWKAVLTDHGPVIN
jgi:hypothetical protein